MNPLKEETIIGTIGELLVQLRLLQFNVQAAPALKDTGNDLIAVKDDSFRAIQVKTTTKDSFILKKNLAKRKYHILAFVKLVTMDDNLHLDQSKIYLLSNVEVEKRTYNVDELFDKELTKERVEQLF